MGDTKWTPEQLTAITESGCNLLVAAAAGAGKTAVLVERIIRKITDEKEPVDIDRLLIVTFTHAAATEMRERIGEAISKALDVNPDSKIFQRQLMLLNRASITTIHSFCLEVIRNHFHAIDLDPNFRISDDTEATLLKLEVLDELLEDWYEKYEPDFQLLLDCYGGSRDDIALQEIILSTYEFVQSCPWPEKWLNEKTEEFKQDKERDFDGTVWSKTLINNALIELDSIERLTRKALNTIKCSEGLGPYLPAFEDDLDKVGNLKMLCIGEEKSKDWANSPISKWDTLYRAFSGLEFCKLGRCGKDADKTAQELVKSYREEVKTRLRKIRDDIFAYDSVQIASDSNSLYPMMRCLSNLVIEFGNRYGEKKKEKCILDFNDLEHLCLKILTLEDEKGEIQPSAAAFEYKEKYIEILVDEYQDSNLVQETLLGVISRSGSEYPNLFMVGDIKQSIYRFRQAKPELFLNKYRTYSMESGNKNRKIKLFKNFRSREEIIHSVNYIFRQIMSADAGELDYDEGEELNLGADYKVYEGSDAYVGGAAELHIIDDTGSDTEEDPETMATEEESGDEYTEDTKTSGGEEEEEQLSTIQLEARMIVKRIQELMQPKDGESFLKVFDKGSKEYRRVEYRDIVILLRTTRNWAEIFVEEMMAQGIPAYADSGTGYFKTFEVQVILSLLEIIDNPLQDIPLLSVLRSPIAAFTAEDLIDIRLADRESSIYEAMIKLSSEKEDSLTDKIKLFMKNLKNWRDKSAYLSTDELIWYLYTDTGYFSYAGAMAAGEQRQANLRILFERARQFEQTSYKGLFNFITYINKLRRSNGDMGSAKILGENENVVRIMSIHKSKGLEFPVVILAGCGKSFNLRDMNKKVLLHQDMGFGPDFVNPDRRISYPSIQKQALRAITKVESLSEEMRILYVAFTRAKEKLIITGVVKGLNRKALKWVNALSLSDEKLPADEMLRAKNYLDWIGPALMRHKECQSLRAFAGISPDESEQLCGIRSDSSSWDINIWTGKDILPGRSEGTADIMQNDLLDIENTSGEYADAVSKRLGWEYAYRRASILPSKMSVTELKRRFNAGSEDEYAGMQLNTPIMVKKPKFLEDIRGLNAAEKGTTLHFVMQHLNLKQVSGEKELSEQLTNMLTMELLTEQQVKEVDLKRMETFFKSEIGKRLIKADKVYREVPFNIEVKCGEIYKDMKENACSGETILLQGVIDCYFAEEDRLVLLDYKTDYVPEGGTKLAAERYRLQLEYYTKALERITGMKVKEKYIYFFWNGEIAAL